MTVMLPEEETLALDEELNYFISIALARTGFSKGTADITEADRKKLLPIMRHYAKMPHPFTACVRDNEKRFGERVNAICAVLKDLIVGNTKWRGKGKPYVPRAIPNSEEGWILAEDAEFVLSYEDDKLETFAAFLSEVTEDEIEAMLEEMKADDSASEVMGITIPPASANYHVAEDASMSCRACIHFAPNPATESGYCSKWEAVAVASYTSEGFESRTPGTGGDQPVAANYSEDEGTYEGMAEINLAVNASVDGEGWAPILYEGHWKLSPASVGGKLLGKGMTIVASGESDPDKIIVSLQELHDNFKKTAVQHVTIPSSHANKTLENTGFIRDVKLGSDPETGKVTLYAKHDFTEPDVKGKVERGTIANRSAGILLNYFAKNTGEKFRAVLDHVALTNKPWIENLRPFGVHASEDIVGLAFSEEVPDEDERDTGGGDNRMSELLTELGMSEDDLKARLARLEKLEAKDRVAEIDLAIKGWEDEKHSPAILEEAKAILLADTKQTSLLLSEDGEETQVTVAEIVKRLVEASPKIDLSDDPIGDEDLEGKRPPEGNDAEIKLSAEERVEATKLYHGGMPEKDAIAKVIEARKNDEA